MVEKELTGGRRKRLVVAELAKTKVAKLGQWNARRREEWQEIRRGIVRRMLLPDSLAGKNIQNKVVDRTRW
jgi:hypothetical protein